jgi:membrane-bound lytic murein transglycosylase D
MLFLRLQHVAEKLYFITKRLTMKLKTLIVLAVFCICTFPKHALAHENSLKSETKVLEDDKVEFDESVIKVRLKKLNSSLDIRYTPEVEKFLKVYIKSYRGTSEQLLGRATMYFQYFDEALLKYNLPLELKMISVIESSLNPNAVSPAGAIGLWQFMPGTAKLMGLDFNRVVDERRDPKKSADAAARYFVKLYSIFNDWNLALAAYNCGPNRVLSAIDAAGGEKDFWAIRKYLPRETQNYIPKLIAISYVFNYYTKHQLKPTFPELDLQITDMTSLYNKVNLKDLSNKLGVPYDVMRVLNPMYRQGVIPASDNAMNIILPTRYMNNFKNSLPRPDAKIFNNSEEVTLNTALNETSYAEMYYTVAKGESLQSIADKTSIPINLLKLWNGLSSFSVNEGQIIKLYILSNMPAVASMPVAALHPLTEQFVKVESMMEDGDFIIASLASLNNEDTTHVITNNEFIYHRLSSKESITDVANQYTGVTVQSIIELNGISKNKMPKPGDLIKIKPLN